MKLFKNKKLLLLSKPIRRGAEKIREKNIERIISIFSSSFYQEWLSQT